MRLQREIGTLESARDELEAQTDARSDGAAQLIQLEAFCDRIREGLDHVNFDATRQILDLVNLQGEMALESADKVRYLQCLFDPLEQQRRLPIQTLPSSNSHGENTIRLTARFVISPHEP